MNRLHEGDCVEGLARLPAESVDLAFADPPFNIGYTYDVYDDRCEAEQYLAWSRAWGQQVARVLKPGGSFWLAIGDEFAAELKLLFQNDLGFRCRSWVVWYYTFGVHCTKKFSRSHAHLFYFVKDPTNFTFNSLAVRVPSARQLVYADARADSRGRVPDDTWILRPQDLPGGFQADEDTWYFSRVCGTFKERAGWHGCQMPEQLLGRIIRACSNPGDMVLDPFAGSGTTLTVAKKLGRHWVGFELSPNYAARARARLDAAREGQPLEGAEEPTVSAPPTPSTRSKRPRADAPLVSAQRHEPEEIHRGILEAFFSVRDGFSPDRVIADPELNERFVDTCRRLGLPGEPGRWNRQLMNARKAGCLKGLPRARTTKLAPEEMDRFSYACEIGLQHLRANGLTLDQVLCEPSAAAEFDRHVQSMISERVSPFRIRWIALHVRKRAKDIRQAGRNLRVAEPLPKEAYRVGTLDLGAVPETAGLYWLRGPDQNLYVGETLNLRERFRRQFERPRFDFWGTAPGSLEMRYSALPGFEEVLLKGNQSRWIAEWKPVGNYAKFAAH